MDGFYLSHAIEAIEVPTEEQVTQFLPPRTPIHVLDPSKPVTMGAWVTEEHYTPFKMRQEEAMNRARTVIKEVNEEFGRIFGRKYGNGLVDPYKTDDAEIILVLMGSMAGTARIVVDQARANGRRIGLLRIRTYRPFPIKDVREILRKAKVVAVISRDISLGAYGGIALSEIRSTLYELQERPHVVGFIVGLGGKDVRTYDFSAIIDQAYDVLEKDRVDKDFNFVK
jgi:pyruvate ferredoxin oxidoreductase alpha subunit